jgi:hypothetical protein
VTSCRGRVAFVQDPRRPEWQKTSTTQHDCKETPAMASRLVNKSTPILFADRIEPSIAFF